MLTPFKRVFVQQFRDAMLSMGLNDSVQGGSDLKFSMYLRANGEKQCPAFVASAPPDRPPHALSSSHPFPSRIEGPTACSRARNWCADPSW